MAIHKNSPPDIAAIDASTLYFANDCINKLKEAPIKIQKSWDVLTTEQGSQPFSYDTLRTTILKLSGAKRNKDGTWNLESYDMGPTAAGTQFLHFIFGLLCLSKVTQAICFNDQIAYMSGTSSAGIGLDRYSSFYQNYEKEVSWFQTLSKKNLDEKYYIESIKKVERIASQLRERAPEFMCERYFELGGYLNCVSNGISHHPIVSDSLTPYGRWTDRTYDFMGIDISELTKSNFSSKLTVPINLVALARFWNYLTNGLAYQTIANMARAEYYVNDYRSPFIFGVMGEEILLKKESRVNRLLHKALYGAKDYSKNTSDIRGDLSIILLTLALEKVSHPNEIIPQIYKLRKKLRPLRETLRNDSSDRSAIREIKGLIQKEKTAKRIESYGLEGSILGIKIPLGNSLSPLWEPICQNKKAKSIMFIKNRYENSASIYESIIDILRQR